MTSRVFGWAINILVFVLIVCCARAEEKDLSEDVSALTAEVARLEQAGDHDQAIRIAHTALTVAEKKSGSNDLTVGELLLTLARLHLMESRNVEAEPLLRRAAEIFESVDDLQRPEVAEALTDLALLYQVQGRYAEATPAYQRALGILRRETDKIDQRRQNAAGPGDEAQKKVQSNTAQSTAMRRLSRDTTPDATDREGIEPEHQQDAREAAKHPPSEEERAVETQEQAEVAIEPQEASPAIPQLGGKPEPEEQKAGEAEVKADPSSPSGGQLEGPANEKAAPAQIAKIDAEEDGGKTERRPVEDAQAKEPTEPAIAPEAAAPPTTQLGEKPGPEEQETEEAEVKAEPGSPSGDQLDGPENEKAVAEQIAKADVEEDGGEAERQSSGPNSEPPTPESPHSNSAAYEWARTERDAPDSPQIQASELMAGLDIVYFRKAVDGEKIVDALKTKQIPYQIVQSQTANLSQSNAIACGTDTKIEALKYLAHTMIESGIPLRVIIQFKNPEAKKQRFEILTLRNDATENGGIRSPALTHEQIDGMEACPQNMQN